MLVYWKHFCLNKKLYAAIGKRDRKELSRNGVTTFPKEDVLKKLQSLCFENKSCVMKVPDSDSFVSKYFFRKMPFFNRFSWFWMYEQDTI